MDTQATGKRCDYAEAWLGLLRGKAVRQVAISAVIQLLGVVLIPCAALPQGTATVQIHAADQSGHGLGPIEVLRFAAAGGAGTDFRERFKGGEAKGIRLGSMRSAFAREASGWADQCSVADDDVFAVLSPGGMFIGSAHLESIEFGPGGAPTLNGIIRGIPSKAAGPIWVRTFRLYPDVESDCCRTAKVGEDGSFSVKLFSAGEYVVIVLNDSGALYNGLLRLSDPSSDVEINLATGDAKVHPVLPQ
jgi:hypothetical protein